MGDQIIIAIGREHGSLGHEIAVRLAKRLNYELYDREILNQIAQTHNIDPEAMKAYDEKPRNVFNSRSVNGFSNSLEEILAEHVFDYERELADSGKSFVIVGRCADYILKDNPHLVSVFICADDDKRLRHIMKSRNLTKKEAEKEIKTIDKRRRSYHNHFAGSGWKDIDNYDLILNSSRLGLEGTMDVILNYVALKKYHLNGTFPDQDVNLDEE